MRVLLVTLCVGEIFSSFGPATGAFPIEREGRVLKCSVQAGEISHCAEPYTGKAVLPRGGKYVECKVVTGYVTTCLATGYNGEATLLTEDPR